MTNNYIVRQIFKKYLPVSIFSTMAATLGMVVGGVITGKFLGEASLAAFGLCSPLFILFAALAGIFSNGSVSVCAACIGRGEKDKVNQVFTVIIVSSAVLSLAFSVLFFLCSPQIASLLGAGNELLAQTQDYIRGFSLGIIPIVMYQVVMSFVRTDGSPSLGLFSVLVMAAVNVVLALANVRIFHMGLFGMALATSMSYFGALFITCIHFFKKINTLHLVKPESVFPCLKEVLLIGMPNAVNRLCNTIRGMFINHVLLFISGGVAVAAFSVQNSLHGVISSVTLGVASTTLLVSGIFYGEEDKRTVEDCLAYSLKIGIFLSVVVSVLGIVFVRPLVSMYSKDQEVIEMAIRLMICYLLSRPMACVNDVLPSYYQSTGNLLMANLVCMGNSLLFIVLSILACTPLLGVDGVWISLIIAELADILMTVCIVWKKKGRCPRKLEDFLLLPEPFGISEENQVDVSLGNKMEDVVNLSLKIEAFCKEHQVDEKRTFFMSLCIEEMAGNVVEYAFGRDQAPHFMDIRVMYKNGELIFRMRDDGKKFNPLEKLSDVEEGREKNIGIRMVSKISKYMDYRYTVGMNNLVVRL